MKKGWQKIVFALLIAATSADAFYKYTGVPGIVAYTLVCIGCVLIVARPQFTGVVERVLTERRTLVIAAILFLALVIVCLLIYPLADAGRLGDRGSDADDALIIGAQALLHGAYPFYPTTYYGNQIAPMPGSIILAIPFAVKPLIALQNVFWLGILFWVTGKLLGSWRYAFLLLAGLVFLSPAVMQNLLTATDRVSNTIYILVAIWLLLKYSADPDAASWKRILPAIFLGIGMSSRSNFFFLVPIFFSALGQTGGCTRAIKMLAISGASFLTVTLPFWLYDPAGFTPFLVQSEKMSQFNSTLPHASVVVAISGMALAILLATRKAGDDLAGFFFNCGVVQLFSVLLLSAISSLHSGKPDLYFGHVSYGVFAVVFFMLAGVIWFKRMSLPTAAALQP
ncbi:MAG: hypothetical protein ACJ73D_11450 [Pyrinomonadaceae bacterium]